MIQIQTNKVLQVTNLLGNLASYVIAIQLPAIKNLRISLINNEKLVGLARMCNPLT